MRPYYAKPSNYTMHNSAGYLMRMSVNRVLPQDGGASCSRMPKR